MVRRVPHTGRSGTAKSVSSTLILPIRRLITGIRFCTILISGYRLVQRLPLWVGWARARVAWCISCRACLMSAGARLRLTVGIFARFPLEIYVVRLALCRKIHFCFPPASKIILRLPCPRLIWTRSSGRLRWRALAARLKSCQRAMRRLLASGGLPCLGARNNG